MEKISAIRGLVAILMAFFWLLPSVGEAATLTVNCGGRGPLTTIQAAVNVARPGDIILVNGVCNENVVIPEEVHRITLDGQGTATINAADATLATIRIEGTGIILKGFTVQGGFRAVQVRRGDATIDGNVIQNATTIGGLGGQGVFVLGGATARIINNKIINNQGDGLRVGDNSHVAIGFTGPRFARVLSPNVIENNGGFGIRAIRFCNATILGNKVLNNGLDGIRIERLCQADVAGNTIDGNGGDGIEVRENSGLNLGNDATGATPDFGDDTNTGNNVGVGVRCLAGAYVSGRVGALDGGAVNFAASCVNNLSP